MSAWDRWGLPAAAAVFLLFAVLLPLVRVRLRTGQTALVVHRSGNLGQRLFAAALVVLFIGLVLFGAAWIAWGPARLGVFARPGWLGAVGYGMLGAGIVVVLAAQAQMGASFRIGIDERPTGLVTHGMYRLVRNPIYTGMHLALFGAVLAAPCIAVLAFASVGVTLIGIQTRIEERHLIALHGEAYLRWASRVGRFVPGIGRLRGRDNPRA